MSIRRCWSRSIALTLAAALFATSLPVGTARAALIGTEQVVEQRSAAGERERLAALLMRDDVRVQMTALGVDRAEALARIASLSDDEIQEIVGRIDQLPAGQGVLEGVLIGAGVVLIVLIITDLLGITNIFMFINPIR